MKGGEGAGGPLGAKHVDGMGIKKGGVGGGGKLGHLVSGLGFEKRGTDGNR